MRNLILTSMCMLGLVSVASADLLFYDGFDYAAGGIPAPWVTAANHEITTPGQTYQRLEVAGNTHRIVVNNGGQAYRAFPTQAMATNGVYYWTMLFIDTVEVWAQEFQNSRQDVSTGDSHMLALRLTQQAGNDILELVIDPDPAAAGEPDWDSADITIKG